MCVCVWKWFHDVCACVNEITFWTVIEWKQSPYSFKQNDPTNMTADDICNTTSNVKITYEAIDR